MGGNFGLALSPLFASALAGVFGWRWAFILLGMIPAIFSVWIIFEPSLKIELKENSLQKNLSAEPKNPSKNYLIVPLIFLFLMAILNGMCYRGLMAFLPTYIFHHLPERSFGISRVGQAGAFTTLILILGMFGQLSGGRLADYYSKPKLYTLAFLFSLPFLFLLSRLEGLILLLDAMIFAFIYFASQPIGNSLLPELTGKGVRGRIYGWFFFMNFGAGSVMSWIAGIIGERWSLNDIFLLLGIVLLGAVFLGFGLISTTSRARRKIYT